ncbi:MAG: DNA alkylation repair protein [Longimicrobiales bacterium]
MTDTDEPLDYAGHIAAALHDLTKHDAASLRNVRRSVSLQIETHAPRAVIAISLELLRTRAPGSHVVAYELILHHPTALAAIRRADLRRLGQTMNSWGEVDTFACYVAGRAWRAGQIRDDVIIQWTRSRNHWWRRAALVSTVPLNVRAQGGGGDPDRTLAICDLLAEDRHPMVSKALSWALRELAVRDAAAVRSFLDDAQDRLPASVIREVRSKLTIAP